MDARDGRPVARGTGALAEVPPSDRVLERVVLSRWAIGAIAAAFVMMGMVVAGYGPLLEHLSSRFGVSLPVAGSTISVYFAGSLPGVIVSMRLLERVPARLLVIVAMAVSSLGLAAVAVSYIWPFFLASVFVVGLGFLVVFGLLGLGGGNSERQAECHHRDP